MSKIVTHVFTPLDQPNLLDQSNRLLLSCAATFVDAEVEEFNRPSDNVEQREIIFRFLKRLPIANYVNTMHYAI